MPLRGWQARARAGARALTGSAFTVLLSSAGQRVALLNDFRSALARLGIGGRVLAADASPLSAAARLADASFVVPACTTPEFVPAVLQLCRQQHVDLVVPTIDTELGAYAGAWDDFASQGTRVAVSSPEAIDICTDKALTHAWLCRRGFPTVAQAEIDEARTRRERWPFPFIAKPRAGSAAVGVLMVNNEAELAAVPPDVDYIVESIAAGREYTVDVLIDGHGTAVCAVPRRRLQVRAGEVRKAVTARIPPIMDVAKEVAEALPGGYGPLTVQVFFDPSDGHVSVIEMNGRFGGGFPLAYEAGAHYPDWIIEELQGGPRRGWTEAWRDGLAMLRYDDAVFVDATELGL